MRRRAPFPVSKTCLAGTGLSLTALTNVGARFSLPFALNFTENPIDHDDLDFLFGTGYEGTSHHVLDREQRGIVSRIARVRYIYIYIQGFIQRFEMEIEVFVHFQRKRAAEAIRGPYNANRHSRYVELVLVIDKKEYIALDENLDKVHQHCKDIANIINAVSRIFTNLRIGIASDYPKSYTVTLV